MKNQQNRMNKIQGIFHKKRGSPKLSPRIDPSATMQETPTNYTATTVATVEPHGCCQESVNVVSMSQSTTKLEQQVDFYFG